MQRRSFNENWTVGPWTSVFARPDAGITKSVTLPHDAMLQSRSASSANGAHTGYFDPGAWRYDKTFDVPQDWADQRAVLEFEGVYRDAMVYVNDEFAGQWASGYSTFRIPIDAYLQYGRPNTIRVEAHAYKDSRWYSGGGIHRPVHLLIGPLVHVAAEGMRITTPQIEERLAVVAVGTPVVNECTRTQTLEVALEIHGPDGALAASDHARVTVRAGQTVLVRQRTYVQNPALWNVDSPRLYRSTVRITQSSGLVDEATSAFGIRSVTADPFNGLRINGKTVKLRGACMHHDNGVIGSVAIAAAEERRVHLLKEAGFNAIRASHNPISVAMLDACDRLGMLVMDEAFDMWTVGKTEHDHSRQFPSWWERDVDAMVAQDFNHPCVIMYSIGNEIIEAGRPLGSSWGRALAERVRSQDPTRLVTNALNGMLAIFDQVPRLAAEFAAAGAGAAPAKEAKETDAEKPAFNNVLSQLEPLMGPLMASSLVTDRLLESSAVLDVVGLNYASSRYVLEHELFPNRVIVGSETFPTKIDQYWKLVMELPHVVGDFTWTGWEYLGEAGIGRAYYPDEPSEIAAPFPRLTAGTGDIGITGRRRPASYYREIVFGLRQQPYLAVQRPQHHHHAFKPAAWSWSDSVASWTWDVPTGSPITVEVYADADEVEFLLNGKSCGRVPIGGQQAFLAQKVLTYQPGRLEAVTFKDGVQTGRSSLETAGSPSRLQLAAERTSITKDGGDLAFIGIALVDERGAVNPVRDQAVQLELQGPAVLQGLGTARPDPTESFLASSCQTYEGRALAVIRPTGIGKVTVTVTAENLLTAMVSIEIL